MEARVRIVEVRAGGARVACDEAVGCGSCSPAGCGSLWSSRPAQRTITLPPGAARIGEVRPGQAAVLVLPDGELLRVIGSTFLPMLAGLVLAPLLARVALNAGEGALFGAAAAGGVAGWLVARQWLRARPPVLAVVACQDDPAV